MLFDCFQLINSLRLLWRQKHQVKYRGARPYPYHLEVLQNDLMETDVVGYL